VDIKAGRMVYLGYGKYWRSDAIEGLRPIEEDRGPGRRTEVYTSTLDEPIVASRSEQVILRDMAVASDEQFRMQEARAILGDLLDGLEDVPDVLQRMLQTEAHFDVARWIRRLRALTREDVADSPEDQPELFG
jgi:hypothetical protein